MINTIVALSLALVALVIILMVVIVFFKSLPPLPQGIWNGLKLQRRERKLLVARKILTESSTVEARSSALAVLRDCFCVDSILPSSALIDRLHTHHLSVLDQFLSLAELAGIQLSTLPRLETLLTTHDSLLREHLETVRTRDEIVRRSKEKGRDTPDWAQEEFQRKITRIRAQLGESKHALEALLIEISSQVREGTASSTVTIH